MTKYEILYSDRLFQKSLINTKADIKEIERYYSSIDNIGKYNFFFNLICQRLKKNLSNTLDLAKFFISKDDFKISIKCLQKLIREEKANTNYIYNLAILYYKLKKYRLSFKYFQKLDKQDIKNERLHLDKSFLYNILKQKKLSRDELYKVLKINNKNFQAIFDLAKLGSEDDFEFILNNYYKNKISDDDLSNKNLDALYFALAYIFENKKKLEESYKFFKKGNFERNRKVFFNSNEVINQINFFQKNPNLWEIGQNSYEINCKEMIKTYSRVHVFIIGLPRSGSTLIEQMLSAHPSFRSYGEIDTFSKYFKFFFTKTNMKHINEDPDEIKNYGAFYNSQFTSSVNKPFIINKMPFNFYSLGFIKKCLNNSIIIYSKRNYKEIAFSLLKNYFSDLKLNFCYSEDNIINYLKIFHETMKKWQSILKENAFYKIEYEDLVKNPSIIKNFFKKYNINWHDDVLRYNYKNNLTDTSSINQVDKEIYTSSVNIDPFFLKKDQDFFNKIDAISLN